MIRVVQIGIPIAGVGVYIKLLASHIDEDKFEVFLISNNEKQEFEILNKSKISITKIHIDIVREINIYKDAKGLFQIIKIIRQIKPDLIHCHSAKAGILGRIAGLLLNTPTFYTPHAYSFLSTDNKIKKSLYRTIEKLFRFSPAYTLACSKSEYNRTIYELKFESRKVYLWPNSTEVPIEDNLIKQNISFPPNYICSIGRPSYQKNIEMLVETVSYIKKSIINIHLVIIGTGLQSTFLTRIESMIKKYDLENNITLIPWIERREVFNIVKESALYISSSRYEGLPYAILEALSCSKPCIVTNVDGNNELIIENYNGYLVEVGDSKCMAKKVIELMENKAEHKRMSNNSRKLFLDNYDIKKNIFKLEEIYLSKISK